MFHFIECYDMAGHLQINDTALLGNAMLTLSDNTALFQRFQRKG